MSGKFMRHRTKHSDHPVQQVRKMCEMSQAKFGAWLGFSEQHIRNVECGAPISQELTLRILILTGAIIDGKSSPPVTMVEDGKIVPFTPALYKDWRGLHRRGGSRYNYLDAVLASLKFTVDVVRDKGKSEDNFIIVDLFHIALSKAVQSLIRDFGLKESIKKRIPLLAQSPVPQHRIMAFYLCEFIDARKLYSTLFA